jgi:type I restriction enzyme S subunit
MTGTKAKRDYAFTAIVQPHHLSGRRLFLNQRVGAIRAVMAELVPILSVFLKAKPLLDLIFATATGTANQANIGAACIRNMPFPLPPIAEQNRIVAKVDELMISCDRLEAQLTSAQTEGSRLLEAALHLALEGTALDELDLKSTLTL